MGTGQVEKALFNGNEEQYELWETKFLGYMRLQKLHTAILPTDEGGAEENDAEKNAEAFAELALAIDDKSLSLILRDAKNDGRKALQLLREHYLSKSETRVIGLYTELTSLKKTSEESLTDYILRGETAASLLKNAWEAISDNLVIAMVLKGLPSEFQSFVTVTTQRSEAHTLASFKLALRTHEETLKPSTSTQDNVMALQGGRVKYGRGGKPKYSRNGRQPRHYEQDKQQKYYRHDKHDDSRHKGMWCDFCKTNTHFTRVCRNKPKEDSAKTVYSTEDYDDHHSYCFKLSAVAPNDKFSSNPQNLESLLVDTGASSHIIRDESKFTSFQDEFEPDKHFIELCDGSKINGIAKGRGTAIVNLLDNKGTVKEAKLENALFVPSFKQSIFSVKRATEKRGVSMEFKTNGSKLKCSDGTTFNIRQTGDFYYLNSVVKTKVKSHSVQKMV